MKHYFKATLDGIKAYTELLEIQINKDEAIRNQRYEEAADLRTLEKKCIEKLPTPETFRFFKNE